MDFGLFSSSMDPSHEGVMESGHFRLSIDPSHQGFSKGFMDYGL